MHTLTPSGVELLWNHAGIDPRYRGGFYSHDFSCWQLLTRKFPIDVVLNTGAWASWPIFNCSTAELTLDRWPQATGSPFKTRMIEMCRRPASESLAPRRQPADLFGRKLGLLAVHHQAYITNMCRRPQARWVTPFLQFNLGGWGGGGDTHAHARTHFRLGRC